MPELNHQWFKKMILAQLLLQILNNQDGKMKKLEQTVNQNMAILEQNMSQNIAAMIQGMSQKMTTRGIEIGQGSGQ
jgi:hypothetical protein